jgi:hypothetical protein
MSQYVLALIAALGGGFIWELLRNSALKAITNNSKVMGEVDKITTSEATNTGNIQSEEQKQAQLQQQAQQIADEKQSIEDMVRWFANNKPDKEDEE